jgi:RNA polymerase sigma-70 factor (ECF subfamily)
MSETSLSLLERVRQRPDDQAWQRLIELYTPFLRDWLVRRHGLQHQDAGDVIQETFLIVLRRLPQFRHNGRPGAFHQWLRRITAHCLLAFWKARGRFPAVGHDRRLLGALKDPDSGLGRLWDEEHRQYLARKALERITPEFEPATLTAFRRVVMEGAKPVQVAADLGVTRNAVDLSVLRVRRRLRQLYEEMQGLF